jgi:hypothetical protein
MTNKKLGVIIPHRDRWDHLKEFKRKITSYLTRKNIDYEIIIVNQDNAKLFNRGMLLNIGFKYAQELKCDYVVFHDVDMLPIHVDYSYSNHPIHLATGFRESEGDSDGELFDEYFGGVTLFPMSDFIKIDGYSNRYWGWGFEDTDLLFRCKIKNIELNELKIKNKNNNCASLKFNGIDAFVKVKNTININRNTTIFISFFPDELTCDHTKDADDFSIFSIPGYDCAISYNSFSRYNFCTFNKKNSAIYINTKIKTNYSTNICIVFDSYRKEIRMFQDGDLVGKEDYFENLFDYSGEKYFYLGVGNPERLENPKYFRGYISSFAVFNNILEDKEIKQISNNRYLGLSQNFGDYISSHELNTYYDSKFIREYKLIDLSGNKNHGEIVNCEITELETDEYKKIKIPLRRESIFKRLPHKKNGFFHNRWKHKETRWNQLRFHNEVSKDYNLIKNDGLSTLEFIEHGKSYEDKILNVNVGI